MASSTDAGTLVYTPTTNADESFTYTASDGNGGTDQATVYVDPGSCGELTVRVEGPDGNLVPGATFAPKYDSDADGTTTAGEQLPEKGMSTGKFTYNVAVSDTPRLSKMNESLMQTIPAGYSGDPSDITLDKAVEITNGQPEPDDHTYQNITNKKSKLATDVTSGGNNPPEINDIITSYGGGSYDEITINEDADDPDGDSLTYEWYEGTGISGAPDGTGPSHDLGSQPCTYSRDWTLWVSDGSLSDQYTKTIEASDSCGS